MKITRQPAIEEVAKPPPMPATTPARPTDEADHHGLGEELKQDVETAGANGHADADFAGPLGDGDEHDVHDANTADDEGDDGNGRQQIGERVLGFIWRWRWYRPCCEC